MIYRILTATLFFFIRDAETVHRLSLVVLRIIGVWPFSANMRGMTGVQNTAL
ncbi:MAG: hypothetical protein AAB923_01630 [Patescibacteria group bacterium]